MLYDRGAVEELVRIGCVIQVSSDSITEPLRRGDTQILKRWIRRGLVHLIASDGHSPDRRPPRMADSLSADRPLGRRKRRQPAL